MKALDDTARSLRLVILDLDGVVYRGKHLLEGADEAVAWLREHGYQVYFLTNNSTLTRREYVERLAGFGIPATEEVIMTSSYATALYFQEKRLIPATVLVIGEGGIEDELKSVGLTVLRKLGKERADFVVAGMDRKFTYRHLHDAQQAILRGARFIATNRDPTYPVEKGGLLPGGGSIVAAIAVAGQQEPLLIGKPATITVEEILKLAERKPEEALIVGDRLDTDIAIGRRTGMKTALVLTGVTTRTEAEAAPPDKRPHWILEALADLPKLLPEGGA